MARTNWTRRGGREDEAIEQPVGRPGTREGRPRGAEGAQDAPQGRAAGDLGEEPIPSGGRHAMRRTGVPRARATGPTERTNAAPSAEPSRRDRAAQDAAEDEARRARRGRGGAGGDDVEPIPSGGRHAMHRTGVPGGRRGRGGD